MSTNLATILVGLGYDLSALEKGAPEAFRLINEQTLGMSAEMKRASREGAESWRLIDEALGIHISRPLTRIVTQEFPAFASALQSVLGAGVIGALGTALFEGFEHAARSIENAQKAQEEFASATEKTKTVFEDAMASYEKAEKLRSLSGLNLELFKIDTASIDEARKHIDDLSKSFDEMIKKGQEASGWWTQFKAFVGDEGHKLTSTPTSLSAEKISQQFGEFQKHFDELEKKDALKGTRESAEFLATTLGVAEARLEDMESHRMTGFQTFLRNQIPTTQTGQNGFSKDEIDNERQYVDLLRQAADIQAAGTKDRGEQENAARNADALAQRKAAIAELQGDLKGWNEAADQFWKSWVKVNEELDKTIPMLSDQALPAAAARFAEFQKVNGPVNTVAPPPGAPPLADQGELQKITDDQVASWQKAGEVLQQIETPLQKYTAQLAVLKELESQGRISTQQFAQAQALLNEQLQQADDRMEKLLKNGGAAGGFQAFWMQLQGQGGKGDGQFTFDLLNKGLQGFEDQTAAALTGAKTHWASFFESLDQMALKFMLNKVFTMLLTGPLSSLLSGFGGGASAASGASASSGMASLYDAGIPAFASGTDYAPGGLSWVGENGPELLNLPAGSSVTPSNAARGGGGSPIFYIDAKGGEIGVEEKIVRAIGQASPHIVMRAVVEASEKVARSLQQR